MPTKKCCYTCTHGEPVDDKTVICDNEESTFYDDVKPNLACCHKYDAG